MKNQEYYYSTLELLKKYSNQLNETIENGSFYCLPYTKRYIRIRQIKRLYNRLRGPIGEKYLISILAAASILVLGVSCKVSPGDGDGGISFKAPVQNPFGLTATSYYAVPAFADLDGDGDMDLLVGEGYYGNFQYFENTGTVNAPAFAAKVQNPFGLTATYYQNFPTFADLDGDGDMDLLAGEHYGNFQYFENTGTVNAPVFAAPVQNPFGLTAPSNFAFPAFADLDGDGDMDLLAGEMYGNFHYFQNTGTVNAPAFAAPVQNPFGLTGIYYYNILTFADLDGDGDMDLLAGEFNLGYAANFQYFQNTGTVNAPAFTAPVPNPFGLTGIYTISSPAFTDLDGDGDMDLLSGDYYGNFHYFENTTP